MAGLTKAETKYLLRALEGQGAQLEEATNAVRVRFPDGAVLIVHWTNSDRKSVDAQRAVVKRSGFLWPFDDRRAVKRLVKELRGRS